MNPVAFTNPELEAAGARDCFQDVSRPSAGPVERLKAEGNGMIVDGESKDDARTENPNKGRQYRTLSRSNTPPHVRGNSKKYKKGQVKQH